MATLCTEIGMPKYRENQKKWKRFFPGNIPANICHRQCLVCVRALQCAPSACTAARSLLNVEGYIFMLHESVRICVHNLQMCVLMWFRLNVCRRVHRHAGVFFFLMYIQRPFSSFPAHFFLPCLMRMRASAKCFFTHTPIASSSSAYRQVFACMCVCVHSQQHAIMMSNGSCSLFTLQPFFLPLYASCLSQRSLASHRHHISHGWIDPRRA